MTNKSPTNSKKPFKLLRPTLLSTTHLQVDPRQHVKSTERSILNDLQLRARQRKIHEFFFVRSYVGSPQVSHGRAVYFDLLQVRKVQEQILWYAKDGFSSHNQAADITNAIRNLVCASWCIDIDHTCDCDIIFGQAAVDVVDERHFQLVRAVEWHLTGGEVKEAKTECQFEHF
jgi:hypothetical protein